MLTVSDLAPLRRMLGAHSMVIRVNQDGTLMPFEIMPELFLGRSIRQLLTGEVRDQFEQVCSEVIDTKTAQVFAPDGFGESDEVMVTPIFDEDGLDCQFLVCWARHVGEDGEPPACDSGLGWHDLDIERVEVRYRAVASGRVEAAPWWAVGDDGIDLWGHHNRVAAVGLSGAVMAELVTEAIPMLVDHDDVQLRLDVPAAEMLPGLIQVCHSVLRATGVDADRIVLGIPVDLAVDADLLPVIVHLRTLGLQIDIVGLDALTAKLHTVSDTSEHRHTLPVVEVAGAGAWTTDAAQAVRESAQL